MNTKLKEKMQKAALEYASPFDIVEEIDMRCNVLDAFYAGNEAMYTELAPLVEWVSVEERFIPNMINPYSIIIRLKSGKTVILGNDYDIMLKSLKDNTLFLKSIGRDDIITHWRKIEL